MGKVDKGIVCTVKDCSNQAERSISKSRLKQGDLSYLDSGNNAYVCKLHYKQWKKSSKNNRELERIRY